MSVYLQTHDNNGNTYSANAPDGSFISQGGCDPANYSAVAMQFSYSGGGFNSPLTRTVCVPHPYQAPAPAPAPAPVYNVTTTVNPQIVSSPQISPIFVQQMQPQNSPVAASTQQIAPTTQVQPPPTAPVYSNPPPVTQSNLPSGAQPVAATPYNIPAQAPDTTQPQAPIMVPLQPQSSSSLPTDTSQLQAPSQNNLTNYTPWIIGAAIVTVLAFFKEGKQSRARS
jgi:hypothetical protein